MNNEDIKEELKEEGLDSVDATDEPVEKEEEPSKKEKKNKQILIDIEL